MSVPAWLQIAVTVIAIFMLSIPTGRYMARIVMGQKTQNSIGCSIRSTTPSIFLSAAG